MSQGGRLVARPGFAPSVIGKDHLKTDFSVRHPIPNARLMS